MQCVTIRGGRGDSGWLTATGYSLASCVSSRGIQDPEVDKAVDGVAQVEELEGKGQGEVVAHGEVGSVLEERANELLDRTWYRVD